MKSENVNDLIKKFNAGELDDEGTRALEQLIESGQVDLDGLGDLSTINDKLNNITFPVPSSELDLRFYQMLAMQKKRSGSGFSWTGIFSWSPLGPKLALASVALIIGIAIGYFARQPDNKSLETLTREISEMREMMMLSLLEKESATERLKAVNLTQEMNQASTMVTNALIQTLNADENVNVRLAALEALVPYVGQSVVREELIRSIAKQDSPLLQLALAELMAKIQERSSVKELQKIIQSDRTPADVKNKIRESIKVLS